MSVLLLIVVAGWSISSSGEEEDVACLLSTELSAYDVDLCFVGWLVMYYVATIRIVKCAEVEVEYHVN